MPVRALGPVSITTPGLLSTGTVAEVAGITASLIGSEFAASELISATKVTGDVAMAAGIGTKVFLGGIMWYGTTKTSGTIQKALWMGSLGSLVSIALDVVHRLAPRATAGLATKLGMAFPVVSAAAPVRVYPMAPAPAAAPSMFM